jgi:Protein of unknown function (DUF3631)/Domain of unknown function (DUF3854)
MNLHAKEGDPPEKGRRATQFALSYLSDRGITPETVADNGIEIATKVLPETYRLRLNFDNWHTGPFHRIIKETIWFRCLDAGGSTQSWIVRIFPTLKGKNGDGETKFLVPRGVASYPYIPAATWHVAQNLKHPLLITEGVPKALAALQAGAHPIALNGVWQVGVKDDAGSTALHLAFNEFAFSGRKVYIAFDADFRTNPSVRQALIRAAILLHKQGAEVKILTWPLSSGKGLDDYLVNTANDSRANTEVLEALYEKTSNLCDVVEPCDLHTIQLEITRAQLSGSALSQIGRALAKMLGIRPSAIEEDCKPAAASVNDRAIIISDPEPWSDEVDGAKLLSDICSVVRTYVSLTENEAITVALWVMLTHVEAYVDTLPILGITSPEKRCGKTTLLKILIRLVKRNFPVSSLTAATIYRIVEEGRPTLIIDEADAFLKDNEELRGILNSGHQRDMAFVARCNMVTGSPEKFSTWCPKAIAKIGKLPETLADRSLSIALKRKTKSDKTKKLRKADFPAMTPLCRKAFRWGQDNGPKLQSVEVSLSSDRAEDNWEPLLAIAKLCGDEWYKKAYRIAADLSADEPDDSVPSVLIRSLQHIVRGSPEDKLFPTDDLATELNKDKEAPWADWKNGLTVHKLGRILTDYGVKSVQRRHRGEAKRGYLRDDEGGIKGLNSVFDRYLPRVTPKNAPQSVTPPADQVSEPIGAVTDSKTQSVTSQIEKIKCDGCNRVPEPIGEQCHGLNAKKGGRGGEEDIFADETVLSAENRYGTQK